MGADSRHEPCTHPAPKLIKIKAAASLPLARHAATTQHSMLPYRGRAGARRACPPRPPLLNFTRRPRPSARRPRAAQPAPTFISVPPDEREETSAHPKLSALFDLYRARDGRDRRHAPASFVKPFVSCMTRFISFAVRAKVQRLIHPAPSYERAGARPSPRSKAHLPASAGKR